MFNCCSPAARVNGTFHNRRPAHVQLPVETDDTSVRLWLVQTANALAFFIYF